MTVSVWRYSHLALAVSSFLFIALAAITGIILSFEPISEKVAAYHADNFNKITLAEAVPAVKKSFSEVTEINIDANQFVIVKGIDTSGNDVSAYIDPRSGKILGNTSNENEFFQWVKALHRSLFLHEAGRFFVGLTAFLLLLIAVTGTILVIKRQRGFKRFFKKIVKENWAQYYHVVLGRLSLIVIIIIALSGTYLSLERFGIFPEKKITHNIDFDAIKAEPVKTLTDFSIFKNTLLSQVQSVEFPFSDDPEDYYTLKLKDREIAINQFSGEALSEVAYPLTAILTNLSLDLHTGRTSAIWAVVLAIASGNVLFFIYSGFVITFKRTANKLKNKYKADECRFIILVGSENGSTLRYANAVHQQLLATGETSFITELNNYTIFPEAENIVILTSTYGLGDAPSNANRFLSLVQKHPQQQNIHFSVAGFGSHAYTDFCRFAFEVNNTLTEQSWATPVLEIHTINDKSPGEFGQWFETWSQQVHLAGIAVTEIVHQPTDLEGMTVVEKTQVTHEDGAFIIRLKPSWRTAFISGDLLAIYPANDHRERFYSIGRTGKQIQLCVKLHEHGLGSRYLYQLNIGDSMQARVVSNTHFRFPQTVPAVIMISNGTGIAPFLGMIDENSKETTCYLYCGFRQRSSLEPFKKSLEKNIQEKKLHGLQVAYSREEKKEYVKDLLAKDTDLIVNTLLSKGVIMLCGSLSMQHDVIALLESICDEKLNKSISFYQSHGQVLMDCY